MYEERTRLACWFESLAETFFPYPFPKRVRDGEAAITSVPAACAPQSIIRVIRAIRGLQPKEKAPGGFRLLGAN